MVKTENFVQIEIHSVEELRTWLQSNCTQKESVWLLIYKKDYGQFYIPKQTIIDELLCFGWLDGIVRKVDEVKYLLLISPRRIEHWSGTYKVRIPLLIKSGKMTEFGLKSVEQSQANGTWSFLDDVDQLIKPADFVEALNQWPFATQNFNAFGASHQRFTLRWIKLAKTDATRKARVTEAAQLANQNQKIKGL